MSEPKIELVNGEGKSMSIAEFQAIIDAGRPQYKTEEELIQAKVKAHDLIGDVVSCMDGHQDEWMISICSKVHFPCVNCNDFFFWGCSDSEEVTEENLPLLKAAIEEVEEISLNIDHRSEDESEKDKGRAFSYGGLLFCARVRKMRPQGAFYKHIPKCLWTKFDECGERRETGFGNPIRNPSDTAEQIAEDKKAYQAELDEMNRKNAK